MRHLFHLIPASARGELRLPVVIVAVLAVLGWTCFIVSSATATWEQREQRLQTAELARTNSGLESDLAELRAASESLRDLKASVEAASADVLRLQQAKADVERELKAARETLSAKERRLSEIAQDLEGPAVVAPEMPTGDTSSARDVSRKPTAERQKRRRGSSRAGRGRRR